MARWAKWTATEKALYDEYWVQGKSIREIAQFHKVAGHRARI